MITLQLILYLVPQQPNCSSVGTVSCGSESWSEHTHFLSSLLQDHSQLNIFSKINYFVIKPFFVLKSGKWNKLLPINKPIDKPIKPRQIPLLLSLLKSMGRLNFSAKFAKNYVLTTIFLYTYLGKPKTLAFLIHFQKHSTILHVMSATFADQISFLLHVGNSQLNLTFIIPPEIIQQEAYTLLPGDTQ